MAECVLRWRTAACGLLLAAGLCGAVGAQTLALRWALEAPAPGEPAVGPRGARLTIAHRGGAALGARGWALYFNCMAGVQAGPVAGALHIDKLPGTFYRLRPADGFAGLASGQTLEVALRHPEAVAKADKAPQGPYLVLDATPASGIPVAAYSVELPTAAALWAGSPTPVVRPEELFRRYAKTSELPPSALPEVFPKPLQSRRSGGVLVLAGPPRVQAPAALAGEAALARSFLPAASASASAAPTVLRLRLGRVPGQASSEAYALTVDASRGIEIVGASPAGVANGLQSLRQLLPLPGQAFEGFQLPALRLVDAPRFEHRGLLLDVARNFMPKAKVLEVIELMARFKLNKLHFHFNDDEGWRLPIEGLPELTDFGARRGQGAMAGEPMLPPAYGSGPDPDRPPGSGHYSRADYRDMLRYAAERHIEVIPELEMPGHARAAVQAMNWRAQRLARGDDGQAMQARLSDLGDRSQFLSAQLYTDNLMDPGLPGTYAFIEHVVQDLVALHRDAGVPLRTLHVGADEVPRGAWTDSPAAQARASALTKKGSTALWNDFYDRVSDILRRHGLKMAAWEELGAHRRTAQSPLRPNPHFVRRGATLYVWNNLDDADDLANRLANAGYRVVLAPVTRLYFDMAHTSDPAEPGHNWAGATDLDQVFDYVPLDALRHTPTESRRPPGKQALSAAGRSRVAGLQATLFSETVRDAERMHYLLMPRLLALAERAWAADPAWTRERRAHRAMQLHAHDWSVFANQLGRQVLPRLDAEMPELHYRIAPPGLAVVDGAVLANQQLPGMPLRFTTDGSDPGPDSPLLVGPIPTQGTVKAAAFSRNGRRGAISTLTPP